MTTPHFENINQEIISIEALEKSFQDFSQKLENAQDDTQFMNTFKAWNTYLNEVSTQSSLAYLHFAQDTQNESYDQTNEHYNELRAKLETLTAQIKKKIIESPRSSVLKESYGDHLFNLWKSEIDSTSPEIEEEMVKIGALTSEYQKLLSSAQVNLRGETYNLSEMRKFSMEPDRELRKEAEDAKWSWFADNKEELDRLYDELVGLRHTVAQKLGYENYIELGYKRMQRTDYGPEEVAKFRQEIEDVIVPLAQELREQQAKDLGIDRVMAWDLNVFSQAGSPKPKGNESWMVDRATDMFNNMGNKLDEFFGLMVDKNYLDLSTRKGKSGGGFCTSFPSVGMPFVFANFNGTLGDVDVFTHEMGHAFQNWSSASHEVPDYQWPTIEACEIHSMSLEFLCYPWMKLFFEEDADRYRREHLMGSVLFLPYGAAVDHYQHLIYENPSMTPQERHDTWLEMEKRYLPWLDWGDTPHASQGGRWQLQRHIYGMPFYYIDYALAQACALQFWVASQEDYDEAMSRYVALCKRGGEASFLDLVKGASLRSPFEPGCLKDVAKQARQAW